MARQDNLSEVEAGLLKRIRESLPILSDLSRSDLLLYRPVGTQGAVVTDQARPHSIFPVYDEDLVGRQVTAHEAPWVLQALVGSALYRGVQSGTVSDVPIVREILSVMGTKGRPIAALSVETNLIAHERHRRRRRPFRQALRQLQASALRGELAGMGDLSPFGEHDGVLVVDLQRRIQYSSGIATNLYRRIGYMSNLVYRSVYSLDTADAEIVDQALSLGTCVEKETREHGRIWVRKAFPLYVQKRRWQFWHRAGAETPHPEGCVATGVMCTIHDATEARDKEQELKAKQAMIQEIHHRVKNNLQVIASLLRLQARRADGAELQQALSDSVNRILSVAVVHEFLSYDGAGVINLREVAQRISGQMDQSIADPAKGIEFRVSGPDIYLSAQKATACALVINELMLNAVEHGYRDRDVGLVSVELVDSGEYVTIEVGDDGTGLPPDFDLEQDGGLGLRIVRTLVQGDLKGHLELRGERGVRATATFPKTIVGGAKR